MGRIAIATDTTTGLSAELLEQHLIHTIPLNLMFGEEIYRDTVDIDTNTFYERLGAIKEGALPTTSQPSAGAFREFYQGIANEGYDEIVSVHISSALSGTVDSALQAKEMLPDLTIHVVDSRLTSMALGYLALEGARALEGGATAAEAVTLMEGIIPRMYVYFAVDTLRYLHMGGRIGAASVLLGTALGIKPILALTGGKIEPACKTRSMKRATQRLVDMLVEQIGAGARVRAATIGAANPEGALQLADMLSERFECVELHTTDLSPVIGTHVGPGAVGALAYAV